MKKTANLIYKPDNLKYKYSSKQSLNEVVSKIKKYHTQGGEKTRCYFCYILFYFPKTFDIFELRNDLIRR